MAQGPLINKRWGCSELPGGCPFWTDPPRARTDAPHNASCTRTIDRKWGARSNHGNITFETSASSAPRISHMCIRMDSDSPFEKPKIWLIYSHIWEIHMWDGKSDTLLFWSTKSNFNFYIFRFWTCALMQWCFYCWSILKKGTLHPFAYLRGMCEWSGRFHAEKLRGTVSPLHSLTCNGFVTNRRFVLILLMFTRKDSITLVAHGDQRHPLFSLPSMSQI